PYGFQRWISENTGFPDKGSKPLSRFHAQALPARCPAPVRPWVHLTSATAPCGWLLELSPTRDVSWIFLQGLATPGGMAGYRPSSQRARLALDPFQVQCSRFVVDGSGEGRFLRSGIRTGAGDARTEDRVEGA